MVPVFVLVRRDPGWNPTLATIRGAPKTVLFVGVLWFVDVQRRATEQNGTKRKREDEKKSRRPFSRVQTKETGFCLNAFMPPGDVHTDLLHGFRFVLPITWGHKTVLTWRGNTIP